MLPEVLRSNLEALTIPMLFGNHYQPIVFVYIWEVTVSDDIIITCITGK